MTINELIGKCENKLQETKQELAPYIFIDEVANFIKEKEDDLLTFKNLVRYMDARTDVITVKTSLMEDGYISSKFYGGICTRQDAYFAVTKKIRRRIEQEMRAIHKELDNQENQQLSFDADYAILDELDSETFSKLFDEE